MTRAHSARREWRWDVALSFAGAQRDYVRQVAAALKVRGVRCFYDADEQVRCQVDDYAAPGRAAACARGSATRSRAHGHGD